MRVQKYNYMEHFEYFYNKQEESAKKDNKEEKGPPSNVVLTHRKVKDLILVLFFRESRFLLEKTIR